MAEFTITIAGYTGFVHCLFESTPHFFHAYLTDAVPDFSITVTRQDLELEQSSLLEEAIREGFRVRHFPDPFLERAAIQRGFAEFLFDREILLLHGSAVAVDGQCYLFTARSGTGKSTHTRLWCQTFGSRAVMINDDKPFLALTERGVTVYGSPWSGKHGLDTNISAPLAGICLLERGTENRIEPAAMEQLLPDLLRQSFRPMAPEKEASLIHMVQALAHRVPLWRMWCTKVPRAALTAFYAMSSQSE